MNPLELHIDLDPRAIGYRGKEHLISLESQKSSFTLNIYRLEDNKGYLYNAICRNLTAIMNMKQILEVSLIFH